MGNQLSLHRHDYTSCNSFDTNLHAAGLCAAPRPMGLPDADQHFARKLWTLENETIKHKSDADLLSHILKPILFGTSTSVACSLLSSHGSIAELVLGARSARANEDEELALAFISSLHEMAARAIGEKLAKAPILSDWKVLNVYLRAKLAYMPNECFRVLYLNTKNILIRDELQGEGTIDAAPCYPRRIIHRALDLGAAAVILVHNHPSGSAAPSKQDIKITQFIARACKPLDISLHDHIIVSRNDITSMRSAGFIV
jgi:DNA repair protein RadC